MNINAALNNLQRLYKIGIIKYPRVENNYIKKSKFQFFPHPPLFEFGESFKPIKEEKLKLTRNTALLYLTNLRLLSPANAKTFWDSITYYLDEKLNFKKEKVEEGKDLLNEIESFLKERELTASKLSSMYYSMFKNSSEAKKAIFKIKRGNFYNLDFIVERLPMITAALKKQEPDEEEIKIYEVNNLEDALLSFREIVKQELQLKTQIKGRK